MDDAVLNRQQERLSAACLCLARAALAALRAIDSEQAPPATDAFRAALVALDQLEPQPVP